MVDKVDLVLKGGRVIDPAQRLVGVMNPAIADGRLVAERYLRPLFCRRAGARHEADAAIPPGLEAAA